MNDDKPPISPTPEMIAGANRASDLSDEALAMLQANVGAALVVVLAVDPSGAVSLHIKSRFGDQVAEGSPLERAIWDFMLRCQESVRRHSDEMFAGQRTVLRDVARPPLGAETPKAKA